MKIHVILVSSSFVLAAAGAQAQSIGKQIINGQLLRDDQIPQMTTLDANGYWTCSATLIGPRVIITASHCVDDERVQTFGPIAGKTYQATLETHPEYLGSSEENLNIPGDFSVKHDVALGVLAEEVVGVVPVSLSDELPGMGQTVLFAGRGLPRKGVRQFGKANVVTISDIGLSIRGFGEAMQIGDSGDSGGSNFVMDGDGEIRVFAVTSTSTRTYDWTERYDWDQALPYTQGIVRIFPRDGAERSPFVEDFVRKHDVEICGVNRACDPVVFK